MKLDLCRLGRGLSVALVLAATLCVGAYATPVPGLYLSPSLGTDILSGRATETWNAGIGDVAGNTLLAQSWDGTTLGTQWALEGAVSQGANLVSDNRVSGTGTVIYHTDYSGGTFYIKSGPWGSGNGNLTSASTDTTVTYFNDSVVGVRANVNAAGAFTSDPLYTLDFAIANGAVVGSGAAKPADYPAFSGTPAASAGTWMNISDMAMNISVVPEPSGLLAMGTGLISLLGMGLGFRKR